jgi:hypothetical protein
MAADPVITAYAIKQSGGKLIATGQTDNIATFGWAVAKGSTLWQARQNALQSLVSNSLYLERPAAMLPGGPLRSARTNAAPSDGATRR